jgi:hypothetical protein
LHFLDSYRWSKLYFRGPTSKGKLLKNHMIRTTRDLSLDLIQLRVKRHQRIHSLVRNRYRILKSKGHSIIIYQIKIVINAKLALRKNQILIDRLQAFVTNQKQSNRTKSTQLKLSTLQVAQDLSPKANFTILFCPKQTNNERTSKSKRWDTSTQHQLNCHHASQSR